MRTPQHAHRVGTEREPQVSPASGSMIAQALAKVAGSRP